MKKVLSLVLIIFVMFTMSISAMAAEDKGTDIRSQYQAIIYKINGEYGLDIHFPTADELAEMNVSSASRQTRGLNDIDKKEPSADMLVQFEKELRAAAETLAKGRIEAEESWEAALKEAEMAESSAAISRDSSVALVRHPKYWWRAVQGGSAYFEGMANDNNGYWVWEYLTKVDFADWMSTVWGDPYKFVMDSYDHVFLDARRTCAVTYIGTMYSYIPIIDIYFPSSGSIYTEWWAGATF